MATSGSETYTPLQKQILHTCASNPQKTSKEISELVDCSESYVRDLQNRFGNVIQNIGELSDSNYMPSFGHPYSIIMTDEFATDHGFFEGDLLGLEFRNEGELETAYGQIQIYQEEMLSPSSKEMQARVHGGYFAGDELQDREETLFEDIDTLDDGRVNLSTDDEFQRYISSINQIMNDSLDDIHLLIGIGLLEISHGERDPSDLISIPYFNLEKKYFPDYLLNQGPELVNLKLYTEEVSEPDEVYFTCYAEQLTEDLRNHIRGDIIDQKIFKSTWNYSLPDYQTVVGPTTTETTNDVIRVTEKSLNIVPGVQRPVHFFDIEKQQFTDLTGETVYEAIQDANPKFESLATHSRHSGELEDLPIRKKDDSLYFLFDQVTLVLTAEGGHMTWLSPQGIDRIETIIDAVNSMIKEQLRLESYEVGEPQQPQNRRLEQTEWALDTNALYHDHVADQPTSILHTIFPHRFFHQSNIHIPWAVMFEMNKHPESGSESEAANEQGMENLAILRSLEHLGFLTVDVQKPPKQINSDISNGDLADIYILAYTDICDARLISGDGSLCSIARLSQIPVVNITQLDSLTAHINDDSTLDEEVRAQIGHDLHTHESIIAAINERMSQDTSLPSPDSSRQSLRDPENILQSWCSQGSLVPYYRPEESSICYASCEEVEVVVANSVLEFLPEYLDRDSGKYLTESFLEQISSSMSHIEGFPKLKIIVPSEYVVSNASSTESPSDYNENLLRLANAENVEYESDPAIQTENSLFKNNTDGLIKTIFSRGEGTPLLTRLDYLALCLAKNRESAYLLLDNDQEGLWKFARLLGVSTIGVSKPHTE